MWELLSKSVGSFLAPYKAYVYGAILAIFIGMVATIAILNARNNTLQTERDDAKFKLNLAEVKLSNCKYSMQNAEDTNNDIFTGIADVDEIHDGITNDFDLFYQKWRDEKKSHCPTVKTTPQSKPTSADLADEAMKQKSIDTAWETYCAVDKTIKGCVQ